MFGTWYTLYTSWDDIGFTIDEWWNSMFFPWSASGVDVLSTSRGAHGGTWIWISWIFVSVPGWHQTSNEPWLLVRLTQSVRHVINEWIVSCLGCVLWSFASSFSNY
jgi:hypothetical protein